MNAVEMSGACFNYGAVEAVKDLNLQVEEKEMFALVGPDGAGKTTAIRLMCGLLQPASGRVSVLGIDLSRGISGVKNRIGYLSQRFGLYGDLTVDENMEFFACIHGVGDFQKRREELLSFTRLTPFRARFAERLSGGMKQKLALACTLIHRPRIVFLDEPTTGVDPVSRREFWLILSELVRQGVSIIMSTPYLDEAERAGRVGLMSRGRLMAVETPAAIKASLRGAVLEILCTNIRRAAEALKSSGVLREVQLFGDRLSAFADDGERGAESARSVLEAAGIHGPSIRRVPPSLENAFISLMRNERETTHEN
jgi:ABC-2 type transport system ATP-binding protein